MIRRNTFLWLWFALVVLATLLVVGINGWTPQRGGSDYATYVGLWLLPGLFTGLGVVISIGQPGNRISRLFLLMGLAALLGVWADLSVPLVAPDPVRPLDALAVIVSNAGYFAFVLIPILLLLFWFPTGTFPTRRWAWAGWVAALAAGTASFAEGFAEELSSLDETIAWTITNPWGFLEAGGIGGQRYSLILTLTVGPLVVGGVASLVVRYRRSSAVVKTQIRWVVYALYLFVVVNLISAFLETYGVAVVVSILFVPVSMGIAINKYKLFEIDRLISRTVSYSIVVGFMASVFAAGVIWIPATFEFEDNALLVAASTLAVAALFNPLRKRVQHQVDRRFNRTAYQAEEVVDVLSRRLRDVIHMDELVELWLESATKSVQPTAAGVWIKPAITD